MIENLPLKNLMTVVDAIKETGYTRTAILAAVRDGLLETYRYGGRIYLSRQQVRDWVKTRAHPGEGWLTVTEAANKAGVTRQAIAQRVLSGKIRFTRTDKIYVWDADL